MCMHFDKACFNLELQSFVKIKNMPTQLSKNIVCKGLEQRNWNHILFVKKFIEHSGNNTPYAMI